MCHARYPADSAGLAAMVKNGKRFLRNNYLALTASVWLCMIVALARPFIDQLIALLCTHITLLVLQGKAFSLWI